MRHWIWFLVLVVVAMFAAQQLKNRRSVAGGIEALQPSLDEAEEQEKYVMLVFTGSDWCIWCKKLDHEILSQDTFRDFADEELVVVVADFPENRSGMSKTTLDRNQKLKSAFPVPGFPTVFLLDPEGRVLARMGYEQGGASAYVQRIREILAKDR